MATLSSATHAPPAKRSKADGRDNEAGGAGGDVPWLLLPGNLPRIGRFAATVTADAGGVAARVALLDGAEELHSLRCDVCVVVAGVVDMFEHVEPCFFLFLSCLFLILTHWHEC